MTDGVVALARTLDQELVALARGVSLACPVCSEFVLHVRGAHGLAIACPECKSILAEGHEVPRARTAVGRADRLSERAARGRGTASALVARRPAPGPAAALGLVAAPRGDRATLPDAGRVTAGVPLRRRARGKSGHRRAGRWGNPRRRKPMDSGTERRPPGLRLR